MTVQLEENSSGLIFICHWWNESSTNCWIVQISKGNGWVCLPVFFSSTDLIYDYGAGYLFIPLDINDSFVICCLQR